MIPNSISVKKNRIKKKFGIHWNIVIEAFSIYESDRAVSQKNSNSNLHFQQLNFSGTFETMEYNTTTNQVCNYSKWGKWSSTNLTKIARKTQFRLRQCNLDNRHMQPQFRGELPRGLGMGCGQGVLSASFGWWDDLGTSPQLSCLEPVTTNSRIRITRLVIAKSHITRSSNRDKKRLKIMSKSPSKHKVCKVTRFFTDY